MVIGIAGLGLIGGSMAKAIKLFTDSCVYGFDASSAVMDAAIKEKSVDGSLTDVNFASCDIVIVALYPADTVEYVKSHAAQFKKNCIVTDCSGVKRFVCGALKEISAAHGFTFIGGHPMAGIERFGYASSFPQLFQNASLVLTPYTDTPSDKIDTVWCFFEKLGFSRLEITSPERHDQMISYTSQLAHVISCAYIDSPLSADFKGFSAGSFKDMTRVARLNEGMWAELFIENKEFLCHETDMLIARLQELSACIKASDKDKLCLLLRRARQTKEFIDSQREE